MAWRMTFAGAQLNGSTEYLVRTDGEINGFEVVARLIGTGLAVNANGYLNGGTVTAMELLDMSGGGAGSVMQHVQIGGGGMDAAALYASHLSDASAIQDQITASNFQFDENSDPSFSATQIVLPGAGGTSLTINGSGFDPQAGVGLIDEIVIQPATGPALTLAGPFGLDQFITALGAYGREFYAILTAGDDTITVVDGLNQYQEIDGGAGDDFLDGGASGGIADYSNAAAGVSVSLESPGSDTGAGLDVFVNIFGVSGTRFSDNLTGNDSANFINGNGGDDVLTGGGGNDGFFYFYDEDSVLGHDRITDFSVGVDRIQLYQFDGVNGVDDVTISQMGSDAVITIAGVGGFSITLDNVSAAALAASPSSFEFGGSSGGGGSTASVVPDGSTQHGDAVTSPASGDSWSNGNAETVTWDSTLIQGGTVNIYVLHDHPASIVTDVNAGNWHQFAFDVPNTGSFAVDPALLGGTGNAYVVLVVSDQGDWDTSEGMFSLNFGAGDGDGNQGDSWIITFDGAQLLGDTEYLVETDREINGLPAMAHLVGTGLSIDGNGFLDGGTITSMELVDGSSGQVLQTINFAEGFDAAALYTTTLAGASAIKGQLTAWGFEVGGEPTPTPEGLDAPGADGSTLTIVGDDFNFETDQGTIDRLVFQPAGGGEPQILEGPWPLNQLVLAVGYSATLYEALTQGDYTITYDGGGDGDGDGDTGTGIVVPDGSTQHGDAVTSPASGDSWSNGNAETVTWDNTLIQGGTVNIYVLHDSPASIVTDVNAGNWHQFAFDVPNTGSFSVDPALLAGTGNAYVVLVVSDQGDWDTSEGMFSLNFGGFVTTEELGDGDNAYVGDPGDNEVAGGQGVDTLFGDTGNDRFVVRDGELEPMEVYDGGDDFDVVEFRGGGVFDLSGVLLSSIEAIELGTGPGTRLILSDNSQASLITLADGDEDVVEMASSLRVDLWNNADIVLLQALLASGVEEVTWSDDRWNGSSVAYLHMDGSITVDATDDAGSQKWATRSSEFDASGELVMEVRGMDDGRRIATSYDQGVKLQQQITDVTDQLPYESQTTTFHANGAAAERTIVFDPDAIVASQTASWDADGNRAGFEQVRTDGRVLELVYDAGNVVSRIVTDGANLFAWDTRVATFDAQGNIQSTIDTLDNGNIIARGAAGNDIVAGGLFNDTLWGFGGADTFVYTGGNDRIRDFSLAEGDRLDLSAFGIVDLAGLEGNASLTQTAAALFIHFDEGGLLRIDGLDTGDLSESIFA